MARPVLAVVTSGAVPVSWPRYSDSSSPLRIIEESAEATTILVPESRVKYPAALSTSILSGRGITP